MKDICKIYRFGLLVPAIMIIIPGIVLSEEQEMPPFSGTYEVDKEASDNIAEAFEPAIDNMNILARTMARRRLRSGIDPDQTIVIRIDEETIFIQSGDRPAAKAPVNGDEIEVEGERGNMVKMRTYIENDVLYLKIRGEQGGFVNEYRLSSDGKTLSVRTEMNFSQLGTPVSYRLVYRR